MTEQPPLNASPISKVLAIIGAIVGIAVGCAAMWFIPLPDDLAILLRPMIGGILGMLGAVLGARAGKAIGDAISGHNE